MPIPDGLKLAYHQRELQHIVWSVVNKQGNVASARQKARIAYLKELIAEIKERMQDG